MTGGEMVHLNTTRHLSATFTSIVAGFKRRYLIAYSRQRHPPQWRRS